LNHSIRINVSFSFLHIFVIAALSTFLRCYYLPRTTVFFEVALFSKVCPHLSGTVHLLDLELVLLPGQISLQVLQLLQLVTDQGLLVLPVLVMKAEKVLQLIWRHVNRLDHADVRLTQVNDILLKGTCHNLQIGVLWSISN
jgi:hypothetical protein